MKYFTRAEVEAIGRAGSWYEYKDNGMKARVLSTFWMHLDPHDLGFTPHQTTRKEGFWEAWITLWMSQNVQPGWRCIDIGANMGYYTLFLLNHGCKVRAVEPQPLLADLIAKSVKENGFKLMFGGVDECAISDTSGDAVPMTVPVGHGMNASIAYDSGGDTIEVEAVTLNDFCEGKQYYDFVKIDVEGAEAAVMRGAKKFIAENPKCIFLLEWRWDRMNDEEARQSANDLFDSFHVSYVGYDGAEYGVVDPEHLATKKNEDWMLVLRNKS